MAQALERVYDLYGDPIEIVNTFLQPCLQGRIEARKEFIGQ
jgi:hypothetical protein